MQKMPAPWSEMYNERDLIGNKSLMTEQASAVASPELSTRRAGILLHPTSLPSGVLDDDVERWLQLLSDTGFSIWQVLPLVEPQGELSPYQSVSAFAMNPVFLPTLVPVNESDRFYTEFCQQQQFWLDDYVLFKVLKQHFNDASWHDWPDQWKYRYPQVLQQAKQQYKKLVVELKWQQYQLHKRWQEIKAKAADLGILLFGDLPIFVGFDSADVWAHPEQFLLDANADMAVVTGVPPDYFSETGQRWGNPHYDWEGMQKDGYVWWKSRINHHLQQFDLLRIDHFRGLEAAWMINASCETAIDGYWQKVPGDALLASLKESYQQLPLVAEDLGVITPEVTALRKKYHLPGMSILQFGFDEFEDNPHKPQNIMEDTVVYTGTHDNDTTKGWFNSLDDQAKHYVLQNLKLLDKVADDESAVTNTADLVLETLLDNALNSRANTCIIPMQDCLHLGSEARMNTPGTITGNWLWQFQWPVLNSSLINEMRLRLKKAQRLVNTNG